MVIIIIRVCFPILQLSMGTNILKKHYIMTKSELINMTLIEIKKINDLLLSIQFNKEKTKLIKQINE